MSAIGLKSRWGQGSIPPGSSRENLFPCPFHLPEATYISGLMVSQPAVSALVLMLPFLVLPSGSLVYPRDP
jgi:hypothetical protein